jgi:hypothetical protein
VVHGLLSWQASVWAQAVPVQESAVQRLPSSQFMSVPLWHTPLLHSSPVVQAFPSLQGPAVLMCWQPAVKGSHESVVQTLPSSHSGVPRQEPELHRSLTVQMLLSLQAKVL